MHACLYLFIYTQIMGHVDALFFSVGSFPTLPSNFNSLHLLFDGSFSDANEESSTSEVIVSYFKKRSVFYVSDNRYD